MSSSGDATRYLRTESWLLRSNDKPSPFASTSVYRGDTYVLGGDTREAGQPAMMIVQPTTTSTPRRSASASADPLLSSYRSPYRRTETSFFRGASRAAAHPAAATSATSAPQPTAAGSGGLAGYVSPYRPSRRERPHLSSTGGATEGPAPYSLGSYTALHTSSPHGPRSRRIVGPTAPAALSAQPQPLAAGAAKVYTRRAAEAHEEHAEYQRKREEARRTRLDHERQLRSEQLEQQLFGGAAASSSSGGGSGGDSARQQGYSGAGGGAGPGRSRAAAAAGAGTAVEGAQRALWRGHTPRAGMVREAQEKEARLRALKYGECNGRHAPPNRRKRSPAQLTSTPRTDLCGQARSRRRRGRGRGSSGNGALPRS
jgi:hypothetical protein